MSANFLRDVTALVLTYNEAPNIDRTLGKLAGLRRILVIDSGSDDGTREIAARHERTTVVVRPFDTHAGQWAFGLSALDPEADWVLALDADYVLSDALIDEIAQISPRSEVSAYRMHFQYWILGKPIRCGAYPPVVALYRRNRARYVQDGHTQRVVIDGSIAELRNPTYHDDRKPLSRWLDSQRSYARIEADALSKADVRLLNWRDRLRTMIGVAPLLVFVYVLVARGGVLDGWRGVYYALQRAYAELLLSLELVERRLRAAPDR
jgi:glycosyltransferase involved in cell wall biosynthesis